MYKLLALVALLATIAPPALAQTPRTEPTTYTSVRREQFDAEVLTRKEPDYPPMAKAAHIEGTVAVELDVTASGAASNAVAVAGHPLLRSAAVSAALAWTFTPPKKNGKRIASEGAILFTFEIDDDNPVLDEELAMPDPGVGETAPEEGESEPGDVGPDEQPRSHEDEAPTANVGLDEWIDAARANPTSADAHVNLASMYFAAGKYDEAIAEYETAISLKPDHERAVISLVMVHQVTGNQDAAIAVMKRALEASPNSATFLNALASMYIRKARFAEAVPVLEKLAGISPNQPMVQYQLGLVYDKVNRQNDAVNALVRATALEPDFAMAYHRLGWMYSRMRRYDDAIDVYTRLLAMGEERYPQMTMVRRELAGVYVATGRHAEAIDMLEKIIQDTPDFLDAYCQIAQAYLILDKLDDAESILKHALRIDREWRCALWFMTELQIRRKDLAKAEETSRQLIGLTEDESAPSHAQLAYILSEQKRFDEAIAELNQAIAAEPYEPQYHVLLANVYKRAGRIADAEAALRRALAMSPDDAVFMNDLGYFLADQGMKLDEAVALLRKAVELEPREPSLQDSLGWALFKSGKLDEAEKYIQSAYAGRPQSAEITEHVGDLAAKRGDMDKAREMWKKAMGMSIATTEQIERLKKKLQPTGST